MDLPQTSFGGGVLDEALHGRFDLAKYDIGLKTGRNIFVHVQGGVSNRPGTQFVGAVQDEAAASRLIPFQRSRALGYVLELGDGVMRILRGGAFVESGGSPVEVVTPWAIDEVAAVTYVQSADVMFLAHPNHPPQKLSRVSDTSWTLAAAGVDPSISAPSPAPVAVATVGTGSRSYAYRVAAVNADGEQSEPSAASTAITNDLTTAGNYNTVTWTAVAGAVEYRVYSRDQETGEFGYIGFTTALTMQDWNISPDLTDTPVQASGLFAAPGAYPGAVTLHKDRLIYAGADDEPETFWASRQAQYENFARNRLVSATGLIEDTVTGPQVNRILHMVSTTQLLMFTEGGEWSVYGAQGLFVPGELVKDPFSAYGAATPPPLRFGTSILFADASGERLQELEFYADSGYDQNDLSVYTEQLFNGSAVRQMAATPAPNRLVWVCLEDGSLLSMAFLKKHQVFAWTEHALGGDGAVESVAAIWEEDEHRLYLTVRRTIDGATRRYVERLATRRFAALEDAVFLDAALSYGGAATDTFAGLDHLEGETVHALADGEVYRDLVVASGSVTLPVAAETVHVGLPYAAEGETLPVAVQQPGRAARGRLGKIHGARVLLQNSALPEVRMTGGEWEPLRYEDPTDWGDPPPLFTGVGIATIGGSRSRAATLAFRQTDPLPMTVLGVIPEVEIG